MIGIIDYGMGNLRSVQKALEKLGYDSIVSSEPSEIFACEKVILPGVGAFGKGMDNLRSEGMDQVVIKCVKEGKPLLGICLGMQMLFDVGYEMGTWRGLGLLKGSVVGFREKGISLEYKVPHIGWSPVTIKDEEFFNGVKDKSFFYFVHSFIVIPEDESAQAAACDYGVTFCSAVRKDNIWATQFHPEKSGNVGLKLLQNFVENKV